MIEYELVQLLGALTQDIILVCDRGHIVREANPLACDLLGGDLIGRPLLSLLSTMSQTKGEAFLEHTRQIAPGTASDTWELLFHVPPTEPLLANVRMGFSTRGYWLVVGTHESPQLSALYHEVLAMNTELTGMIRELSREQVRLSNQVSRLLAEQAQE